MTGSGNRGPRPGPAVVLLVVGACLLAPACRGRQGVPVEGSVTRTDGRPVSGGEVWLEPADAALADARTVRRPIDAGRFHFSATDGVQPGKWTVRVYPPSLGSGASDAEIASLFEPINDSVTIVKPSGQLPATLEFEVSPLRSAAREPSPAGR